VARLRLSILAWKASGSLSNINIILEEKVIKAFKCLCLSLLLLYFSLHGETTPDKIPPLGRLDFQFVDGSGDSVFLYDKLSLKVF
jgi:hypothetical protein